MSKLCGCGCGSFVRKDSRFLPGHNSKVAHPMLGKHHSKESRKKQSETIRSGGRESRPCACGCGQMTSLGSRYIHGHNTRGKPRSPQVRRKISEAQKGYFNLTPEQTEKMRLGVIAAWQDPNSGYHNPEYKEKLAKANREREHYWGDKISRSQRGKKLSKEARRKMSLAKGGTGIPKPPLRGNGWTPPLRRAIRKRDHFTCQEPGCVRMGKHLDVHHINYVSTDHRSENLITLCRSHHAQTNARNERRDYYQRRYMVILWARGLL